jgi:transcriptional regulator with XRE-family HTH domain
MDMPMKAILAAHSFGSCLRTIRQRHLGKQLILSLAVGCTDAAVSYWENDRRLPTVNTFLRLRSALRACGATAAELDGLYACWREEVTSRAAPTADWRVEPTYEFG